MELEFQSLTHYLKNLELNIFRDGNEYEIKFQRWKFIKPLKKIGKTKKMDKN